VIAARRTSGLTPFGTTAVMPIEDDHRRVAAGAEVREGVEPVFRDGRVVALAAEDRLERLAGRVVVLRSAGASPYQTDPTSPTGIGERARPETGDAR
jgi:hypothetical protein